jgi:1-deoxy-D-xylulose 5-phosphate reductoisomerase
MAFPHWEEVFKKIKKEEPLEYTPHRDPETRKLDEEVLFNIHKAYLHMVASQYPVFPCIELLKWIIDHTDTQKCLINDDNDECVRVFLPLEVQSYYKLKDSELNLSTNFVLSFYVSHDTNKIMSS